MNDWLNILEAFRDGKFPDYFYGLTPRFIIGVCQIPVGKRFNSSELAYEAVKKMFNEMRAFNINGVIVVSNKCGIHSGPVMSLSTAKWTEESIATSVYEIWERYGEEIIQGDYHISQAERKIVEKIFSA